MDSPTENSPKKQRKVTLVEPEVSQKKLDAIQDRLRRWMRRDMWRLREGCDLAWHILPARGIRQIYISRIVDSENLCEWAERAVEAGTLPAKRLDGPASEWWVRPTDFCRWISKQDQLIGLGRASLFLNAIPTDPAPDNLAVRRKVLESEYSTPEFDAALEAIAEFWLTIRKGDKPPNNKVVISWLVKEKGLSQNAAERVDTLIRHPDAKPGGRKSLTQRTQ